MCVCVCVYIYMYVCVNFKIQINQLTFLDHWMIMKASLYQIPCIYYLLSHFKRSTYKKSIALNIVVTEKTARQL